MVEHKHHLSILTLWVQVLSSVKNAGTRIVLSRTCQYPYRPQSKRPVPASSSDKKPSTGIVYRHWSHGCSSNGILPVWARQKKGQYPYRPQSKRPVPALAAQYPHRDFARLGTYMNTHTLWYITTRILHHSSQPYLTTMTSLSTVVEFVLLGRRTT
jgi:hypothetical protein